MRTIVSISRPIGHKPAPLLELLPTLIGGHGFVLVLVRQRRLTHAIRIIGALLGPCGEGRAESMHGDVAVIHAIQHREHCHVEKRLVAVAREDQAGLAAVAHFVEDPQCGFGERDAMVLEAPVNPIEIAGLLAIQKSKPAVSATAAQVAAAGAGPKPRAQLSCLTCLSLVGLTW
jgi:hypothetical protein